MKIAPFGTEHFFDQYEFVTPYLLSVSDCETISVRELLALAGMPAESLGGLRLGYTESAGDPALREAIANTYDTVEADHILVLATPVEGIYLTIRTLLEPQDEVIVLMPAYDALFNVAEHVAGKTHPWPVVATENCWRLDLDGLRQLINDKTRLLVVNFPHNPTGLLPSLDEFQELIEIARQAGLWLFCDEMYRGLEYGEAARLPSAADLYEKAVVLAGLSKSYGLPGLRSGWLVVKDEDARKEFINWKFYTSICPPGPSMLLAQAALAAGERLMARSRETIAQNLLLADDFFKRHAGLFQWRPPMAGSVALVGLNLEALKADSAADYCHHLANEAGVLLAPGENLGAENHFVRFGFGRNAFAVALAHYDEYLRKG